MPLAHEAGQQGLASAALADQQQVPHGHFQHAVDAHNVFQCFVIKLHVDVAFELFVLFECLELFSKFASQSFLVMRYVFAVDQTGLNYGFLERLFDVVLLAKLLVEKRVKYPLDILFVVWFGHAVLPQPERLVACESDQILGRETLAFCDPGPQC